MITVIEKTKQLDNVDLATLIETHDIAQTPPALVSELADRLYNATANYTELCDSAPALLRALTDVIDIIDARGDEMSAEYVAAKRDAEPDSRIDPFLDPCPLMTPLPRFPAVKAVES